MLNLRGGAIEMKSALVFSLGAVKRDRKEELLVDESSLDLLEGCHLGFHGHTRTGVSWRGVVLWPIVWIVLAIVSNSFERDG